MTLSLENIMKVRAFLVKNETYLKTTSRRNKMLSDPTRIRIIMLLRKYKELCPTDIVKVLKITPSAVSHQMRALEQLEMVKRVRMGKMMYYSLNMKFLKWDGK